MIVMIHYSDKYSQIIHNLECFIQDLSNFSSHIPSIRVFLYQNVFQYITSEFELKNILKRKYEIYKENQNQVKTILNQIWAIFDNSLVREMLTPGNRSKLLFLFNEQAIFIPDNIIQEIYNSNGFLLLSERSHITSKIDKDFLNSILTHREDLQSQKLDITNYIKNLISENQNLFDKYLFFYQNGFIKPNEKTGYPAFFTILNHFTNPFSKYFDELKNLKAPILQYDKINGDHIVPIMIWGVRQLIIDLQQRLNLDYWINKYCERAGSFNKLFVLNLKRNLSVPQNTSEEKNLKDQEKLSEDFVTQDLLLYLFDQGIPFKYDERKQGLRPDVSLVHSVLEIKYIKPDIKKSQIKHLINSALKQLHLQ